MTADPNEVVKVYSGPLVVVEAYKQALADAGIESKMAGDRCWRASARPFPARSSSTSISAISRRPWRRSSAMRRSEWTRGRKVKGQLRPAANDPKPDGTQHRVKHHIPPHPTGQ